MDAVKTKKADMLNMYAFSRNWQGFCVLGPSWGPLGAFLGRLGGLWSRLEAMLGVLERFEAVWGASWIVLGLEGRNQRDDSLSNWGGAPPPLGALISPGSASGIPPFESTTPVLDAFLADVPEEER